MDYSPEDKALYGADNLPDCINALPDRDQD